jgi:D-alanyl-D-alanine carboxypeptidase/D-alanyl-D-alanine-endopeptidase (penicillin-binding protein 4)
VPQEDRDHLIIKGKIPVKRGKPVKRYLRINFPSLLAGFVFYSQLKSQGIAISGTVKHGKVSKGAIELATHESHPLEKMLMDINKHSNNFMAEMVLSALGGFVFGQPGNPKKGIDVIVDLLSAMGIKKGSYKLQNGSGLFDANRFTARQITTLLAYMYHHPTLSYPYITSLAIGGLDGTLRRRMQSGPVSGRFWGKTGTLDRVASLAGYLKTSRGRMVGFVVLVEGFTCDIHEVRKIMDDIMLHVYQTY